MRPIADLLDDALAAGDDRLLRAELIDNSRLPGPRANLGLLDAFAAAVGDVASRADPPVDTLETLLDAWAAIPADEAPTDQPDVMLPCAAVLAYGEVAAVRPEWWQDEIAKLRRAAADTRWRVREIVAQALQRMLAADWSHTVDALRQWAAEDDPLVLRAVAAAVAEPPLLAGAGHAADASDLQRLVVDRYRKYPSERRGGEAERVLRQGLGYTISVIVAATGDFNLLEELAASDDTDLRWIAKQNVGKNRLKTWPDRVALVVQLLG